MGKQRVTKSSWDKTVREYTYSIGGKDKEKRNKIIWQKSRQKYSDTMAGKEFQKQALQILHLCCIWLPFIFQTPEGQDRKYDFFRESSVYFFPNIHQSLSSVKIN